MRKHELLLFFILGVTSSVLYAEPPAPYLKDGTIVVHLKSGKQYKFDANKWKVVPRRDDTEVEVEQPKLDLSVEGTTAHGVVIVREVNERPNRITLHGGVGPTSMRNGAILGGLRINTTYGAVFGATYSRKLDTRTSISGTVLSNQTGLLGVGVDF